MGFAGSHRLNVRESSEIRTVQWIGLLGLRTNQPWQTIQSSQDPASGGNRFRSPTRFPGFHRHNNEVRHSPLQLLNDFKGDGLLAFDAERIQRVREINGIVLCDLLNQLHASVEVRVDRYRQRAVRGRLNELRQRNLVLGQKYNGGMPAAAQYADSAADVSPVEAQATARTLDRIWLTIETRTVMPRSLKEPV
jgi:hypothetical protein